MGHMLNNTIQDVLIRRARMLGKNACGFQDRSCFNSYGSQSGGQLKAEGIEKRDLQREEFLHHAWDWTNRHGCIILEQLKKTGGLHVTGNRTLFTWMIKRYESVIKVFIDLYNKD